MKFSFFLERLKAKVKLPTRPQYINKTITILESIVSCLVIPVEIPTVPSAEKISKKHLALEVEVACQKVQLHL